MMFSDLKSAQTLVSVLCSVAETHIFQFGTNLSPWAPTMLAGTPLLVRGGIMRPESNFDCALTEQWILSKKS